MSYFQNEIGVGYRFSDHLVFFGNRSCDEKSLSKEFPQFKFHRIRQTHSDIVVEASNSVQEADAQFTSEKFAAAVVATADCIPLMFFCRQTNRVAAVHAGWKGVQNHITKNALNALKATGSYDTNFNFYIGPHIRQNSFETDHDVYTSLLAAHPGIAPNTFSVRRNGKYFLDLNYLIRHQIEIFLKIPVTVHDVSIDTKTDLGFHSYRREKASSGRNLNFIVRI